MKKCMKRVLAAGLVMVVMMSFAGCKKKDFDASGYVKATLDMTMKGETKEYVKFTGCSEEEAIEDYEHTFDKVLEQFEDLGLGEAALEKYRQFNIDLYKLAKYDVKESNKEKDGYYTVKVEVKKMNIFAGVMEKFAETAEQYVEGTVAAALEGGEQLTDEKVQQELYEKLIDLYVEGLANVTYQEPTTVEVKVRQDEDGEWMIPDKDIEALMSSLMDEEAVK